MKTKQEQIQEIEKDWLKTHAGTVLKDLIQRKMF
jgi:hypothetical protein